jgi:hypothetical protein
MEVRRMREESEIAHIDIIRMAQESGWGPFTAKLHEKQITIFFERAYEAGAAAEREACAELCEGHYDTAQAARAIRTRGEK